MRKPNSVPPPQSAVSYGQRTISRQTGLSALALASNSLRGRLFIADAPTLVLLRQRRLLGWMP